jgi:hypothetical protein
LGDPTVISVSLPLSKAFAMAGFTYMPDPRHGPGASRAEYPLLNIPQT